MKNPPLASIARRWLPPVAHAIEPYVIGPRIDESLTARPQSPKNSARRSAGLRYPTSARLADCEAPKHRPARLAATQNSPGPDAHQAIRVVTIHSHRVSAMVLTSPSRSSTWPKAKAPTAAGG